MKASKSGYAIVSALWIVFLIILLSVFGLYIGISLSGSSMACQAALASDCSLPPEIDLAHPLLATVNPENRSQIIVPVLTMAPNSSAEIYVLYNVTVSGLLLTQTPEVALPGGAMVLHVIRFQGVKLLWETSNLELISYMLVALSNSSGYYSIRFPFGCGNGFALGVLPEGIHTLDVTQLQPFGYDGVYLCQDLTLASSIVGFSGNMTLSHVHLIAFNSTNH